MKPTLMFKSSIMPILLASVFLLGACKKDNEPKSSAEFSECLVVLNTFDVAHNLTGQPRDLAEDPAGNIVVLIDKGNHASVAKFDFEGSLIWEIEYTGFAGEAQNVIADSDGNILFTCSEDDFVTTNLSNQLQGSVQIGIKHDSLNDCLPDYMFGTSDVEETVNNSVTNLIKLDMDGTVLFSSAVPGNWSSGNALIELDAGYAIACSQSSGIFAEVSYMATYPIILYPYDLGSVIVTRFTDSGTILWDTEIDNALAGGYQLQELLELDLVETGGTLYVRTIREVYELDGSGVLLDRHNPVHGYCSNMLYALGRGDIGQVVVHGAFYDGGNPTADRYIAQFGPGGASTWNIAEPIGLSNESTFRGFESGGFLQADAGNSATSEVRRYSATGSIEWSNDYTNASNESVRCINHSCYDGAIMVVADDAGTSFRLLKTDASGTI